MNRLRSSVVLFAAIAHCATLAPALLATPPLTVQPLDGLTVAVSDFTEAGRLLPVPTPESPIYYTAINAGHKEYIGTTLAGDPPPAEQAMLQVIVHVLAKQGYLAATPEHPATQIIVCSWGTLGSTGGRSLFGPAKTPLTFLGGDKMGLIEDTSFGGSDGTDVFRRRFRSGTADTINEMACDSLYAVLLRAYDSKAADEGRIVQLWETRISCASPGNSLAKALPRLVVSGRNAIGRDTPMPVVENAARTRREVFDFPELQVLEYIEPEDLARAREEQTKNPPAKK